MAKYRQERVSHEIMRIISVALRENIKDPRLDDVTVTDVSISSDLSIASVRWLCSKKDDRDAVALSLQKATPYFRSCIGEQMALRRIPNLRFFYDDSYEKGEEISALLAKLRAEGQMGDDDGI